MLSPCSLALHWPCLLGVLGTILSCVPYAESLVPQSEWQAFQNLKGYLNIGKTCLNKHLLCIQSQIFLRNSATTSV